MSLNHRSVHDWRIGTHHDLPSTPTPSHLSPPGSTRTSGDRIITVDWDGPYDPENPRNWSFGKKWQATMIVSAFTFISPVSSLMIAPASRQLAERFDIHSSVLVAMTVSVFVLAYVWNIGCGFASSMSMLIAFRFLAGLGGSAPKSISGGVTGDLFDAEHRGQAISIYSLAILLGPVIGPVAGALVAEKSTWRWVAYAAVLLERKAAKIRKSMDEEKANGITICTAMDATDRQFVAISRTVGKPYSAKPSFDPSSYSYSNLRLLVYLALIYGLLIVRTQNLF